MARKHQRLRPPGSPILVVDDDPEVRRSLVALLEREGHEVTAAEDGPAAIRACQDGRFELMLLDYHMPGMTGAEVVRAVRASLPDLQIVLQTGYASEHPPRETLRQLDIQGYHDKTEGPERLLLWVDAALKAGRHLRAIRAGQLGLLQILRATPQIHRFQPLEDLLQGIFTQLLGFMQASDGFVAVGDMDVSGYVATFDGSEMALPVRAGRYRGMRLVRDLPPEEQEILERTVAQEQLVVDEDQITVPLLVGSRMVGVVHIACPPPPESNLELLRVFANQAAVAIENLQLYQAVSHDHLTGVLSKAYFQQSARQLLQLAVRHRHPLTLLVIDLDRFKALNDTHGHLVGDRAIATVARTLLEAVRATDLVGRYGGDEFMVLLPETPLSGAEVVAERIVRAARELDFRIDDLRLELTVSVGVAGAESPLSPMDPPGEPAPDVHQRYEQLFDAADRALYLAKAAGRNTWACERLAPC